MNNKHTRLNQINKSLKEKIYYCNKKLLLILFLLMNFMNITMEKSEDEYINTLATQSIQNSLQNQYNNQSAENSSKISTKFSVSFSSKNQILKQWLEEHGHCSQFFTWKEIKKRTQGKKKNKTNYTLSLYFPTKEYFDKRSDLIDLIKDLSYFFYKSINIDYFIDTYLDKIEKSKFQLKNDKGNIIYNNYFLIITKDQNDQYIDVVITTDIDSKNIILRIMYYLYELSYLIIYKINKNNGHFMLSFVKNNLNKIKYIHQKEILFYLEKQLELNNKWILKDSKDSILIPFIDLNLQQNNHILQQINQLYNLFDIKPIQPQTLTETLFIPIDHNNQNEINEFYNNEFYNNPESIQLLESLDQRKILHNIIQAESIKIDLIHNSQKKFIELIEFLFVVIEKLPLLLIQLAKKMENPIINSDDIMQNIFLENFLKNFYNKIIFYEKKNGCGICQLRENKYNNFYLNIISQKPEDKNFKISILTKDDSDNYKEICILSFLINKNFSIDKDNRLYSIFTIEYFKNETDSIKLSFDDTKNLYRIDFLYKNQMFLCLYNYLNKHYILTNYKGQKITTISKNQEEIIDLIKKQLEKQHNN